MKKIDTDLHALLDQAELRGAETGQAHVLRMLATLTEVANHWDNLSEHTRSTVGSSVHQAVLEARISLVEGR